MQNNYYKNLSVCITGASSGIGFALAKNYLQKGCTNLGILDRNELNAAQKDTLKKANSNATIVFKSTDISNADEVKTNVSDLYKEFGQLNLVVNCAGIANNYFFNDTSNELLCKTIDINLKGSAYIASASFPYLKESKGHLVLVASMAGFVHSIGYSAYSASKSGVVALGNILKLEYATHDVDVSLFCPPEISTPMITHERKHISQTALKLKKMAGILSLDYAIPILDKGIRKRKHLIIPGFKAKIIYFLSTRLPNLTRKSTQLLYKRFLKKFNEEPT